MVYIENALFYKFYKLMWFIIGMVWILDMPYIQTINKKDNLILYLLRVKKNVFTLKILNTKWQHFGFVFIIVYAIPIPRYAISNFALYHACVYVCFKENANKVHPL